MKETPDETHGIRAGGPDQPPAQYRGPERHQGGHSPSAPPHTGILALTPVLAALAALTWLAGAGAAQLPIIAGLDVGTLLQRAASRNHPLVPVVERVMAGDAGVQPAWKPPMLVNGLRKQPLRCTITAYCERCPDGGGRTTRWGSRTRRGICAADPRYWGPGSVVWIGDPINETLVVEDTGGAIKGPHRFDVCMTGHHAMCRIIGLRRGITYVPLYRTPPKRRWSQKPKGWQPPVWAQSEPSTPDQETPAQG